MKPKVLILIDWFLPGHKAGGPVKSIYSLVKSLQNQVDFYIITMNTDIHSNKAYPVKPNTWTTYEQIPVFYFSKTHFSASTLIAQIRKINPDLIYLNSLWSYYFSILPLTLKRFGLLSIPILLAPRGMLEYGAMHTKSLKKNITLFLLKTLGFYKNVFFHATGKEEQQSIEKYFPKAPVVQIQNLSYISDIPVSSIEKKKHHLKLFFLSRISPIKNLEFAIQTLQRLNASRSFIEYDIYGHVEDKAYFQQCRNLINQLPENIKVSYKGIIEFDAVAHIISHYHFLFLPTKNENFGHSIVETLSCGRPVLISHCTPWNAVNTNNCGYALPLDEQLFAEKLQTMLEMDNHTFQTMCRNAQTFIQQRLNTETIQQAYFNLFKYVRTNIKHTG